MAETRYNTLSITTPEGITFSMPLASPIMRFLAWGCDFVCIALAQSLLQQVAGISAAISSDAASALFIILNFALNIGYAILFEWLWRGQTPGKRLFRLRVLDSQGLRLQFSQVVIRNLLRAVDSLPAFYLVGGIAGFLSPLSQRLGDMAADTVVIRSPKASEPDLDQVAGQKFNSLRQYPHLVGRLRQRITPREADIALQALLRRERLDDRARVRLFDTLAAHFQQAAMFPEEATLGLTSEQYVRNVVDVLFKVKV